MPWNQRIPLSSFWCRPLSAGLPIVLAVLALSVSPAGAETIEESKRSFKVGDKTITMDCFAPGAAGRHPAILLLHGSEGMCDALIYQCIAKDLARQGYVALIAHYFERTGTKRIEPKDIRKNKELFDAWMETVRRAVLHAAKLPEVDRRRIGLLGFSLGAYLSLAVAVQTDVPVAAVVDLFGGLPEGLEENAVKLPPVLIVHGAKDRTVPVAQARALERLLRQHKRPCEMKIYERQDHLFKGDRLGADACDARTLTLTFFGKYLQPLRAIRAP
jgi:dienelactone hydrolase